jgi:hypothetical protein
MVLSEMRPKIYFGPWIILALKQIKMIEIHIWQQSYNIIKIKHCYMTGKFILALKMNLKWT